MKSILVPIDFSKPAEHAARYALHLAKYLRSDITLCHAVYMPMEVPTEGFGAWPGYDITTLKQESINALEVVASKMRNKITEFSLPGTFQPKISCVAEIGGVTDVINELASKQKANLTIMGMTGAGAIARLLLGSISRSMIDKTQVPLLLVPQDFVFSKIKKIAFATSLVDDDIDVLHSLAGFAGYFDANILVAHVSDLAVPDAVHQKKFDGFLSQVTCKINYDKIYYRHVNRLDVNQGLEWLAEHGAIDLLVMVHRQKGLFNSIFSSHTHSSANNLNVPLMIMPANLHPVF